MCSIGDITSNISDLLWDLFVRDDDFFSCLVMIAYGVSAFLSFQAWRGAGSNAATSQMAGGYS